MTRGMRFGGLRQQAHQLPCPYCGKRFSDVLRHLNHRESKCSSWFGLPPTTRSTSPHPSRFTDEMPPLPPPDDPNDFDLAGLVIPTCSPPHPFRTDFPTAAKVYGRTRSFLDRFNSDKYASYRTQNAYYPFADQEEWELGSFLLGSGMSMNKVDEFLKLKLVCKFYYPFPSLVDHNLG